MPEPSASNTASDVQSAAGESEYRRARERLAANDLDGAAGWLEQAAAKGHPAALTELAITHLHGFGRDPDPARAVQLLLRAQVEGGTPETPYLLAQIAMGGVALSRDPKRIDDWLADSARRGYAAALRVAGLLFGQQAEGAFQRAATECFARAAQARDPVGAALYADRLHAGRGISRDLERALDLARELRSMDVPVELPAPETGIEPVAAEADVRIEPPWHALHVPDATLPPLGILSEGPEITTCEDLASDEECRYLIYSGARYTTRSLVVEPITGRQLEYGIRTSHDMTFVPTFDDIGIRILQLRMARMAGFELGHCEPLTLLHYRTGDEYRPHRDYFPPSAPQLLQPGGQRHSTVCLYLNDVELGGETVFPVKNLTVRPRRGRAVMFRSLHADQTPDPGSLHAGLPVTSGEKWLASCWIRLHPARPF